MESTQPWFRVFVDGFAPNMSAAELEALRDGLLADDSRILQGTTTNPLPLLCVSEWPCEGACPFAYVEMAMQDAMGMQATVGECEQRFAQLCYGADALLGDRSGCRHLLNWIDSTPRAEMIRNLLAAVNGVLESRSSTDRVNAALAGIREEELATTQGE